MAVNTNKNSPKSPPGVNIPAYGVRGSGHEKKCFEAGLYGMRSFIDGKTFIDGYGVVGNV